MVKDKKRTFLEVRNKKVFHDYFVEEKIEAGVILQGTEVKAIREGKAQINEAFVRFENGRPVLFNSYIEEYSFGNENNHNPRRSRKLLLKKREINKLRAAIEAKGKTLLATRLYLKSGLVKVEVAICSGKKLFDKREDLKRKDAMREAEKDLKARQRG